MGALHVDRFLMVYDLRAMRALAPMQVNLEPMFIRCIPALSKICMVSQVRFSMNRAEHKPEFCLGNFSRVPEFRLGRFDFYLGTFSRVAG